MRKIFTKGLGKDAQKEGLFKRLENIKGKNEELLNELRRPNEVSKTTKYESEYNYDSKDTFYKFYRDYEDFKRIASMDSKHRKLIEFYNLLGDFVESHKAIKNKRKNCKNGVSINVNPLYDKYFDAYKKNTIVKI